MAVSTEVARTILSEWVGQAPSDQEIEELCARYAALSRSLAALPDEELRWVEPALHSVPALEPGEDGR